MEVNGESNMICPNRIRKVESATDKDDDKEWLLDAENAPEDESDDTAGETEGRAWTEIMLFTNCKHAAEPNECPKQWNLVLE